MLGLRSDWEGLPYCPTISESLVTLFCMFKLIQV